MHFIYCLDVDECKVRNPCKNGAKCVNSVGGYSCQCPANYKGKHCDEGIGKINFPLSVFFLFKSGWVCCLQPRKVYTKPNKQAYLKIIQFSLIVFRC